MSEFRRRGAIVAMLVVALSSVVIPSANAYIDPGSGSFIVQMAVGAILGASLAIKVFWRRLVSFFTGRKNGATEEEPDSPES